MGVHELSCLPLGPQLWTQTRVWVVDTEGEETKGTRERRKPRPTARQRHRARRERRRTRSLRGTPGLRQSGGEVRSQQGQMVHRGRWFTGRVE